MADEERDWKGSKFEMILIGSGWLKETKTHRKYQKFIINKAFDQEIRPGDIVCAYLAKNRKNENSPNYYLFLDVNAREKRLLKEDKKLHPPQDPDENDGRDGDDPDSF